MTEPGSISEYLRSLVENGRLTNDEYNTALLLIQQDDGQRRQSHLVDLATPVPWRNVSSRQIATASAVFNTVELIEEIFSYLDLQDLVNGVSRTCHRFRNIVNTTPALRRRMYTLPDVKSDLRLPSIRSVHYTVSSGYIEILMLNATTTFSSYPALQSMLLTQPPIKTIQIFYDCSCRTLDAGRITSQTGLRFGQVSLMLDQHFKTSKATHASTRPCTCTIVKEARLISKRVDT